MTKYVHIVQVHPVENGEPNFYKVEFEKEFDTEANAEYWIQQFHLANKEMRDYVPERHAFYLGRVNDATGELE